MLYSSVTLNGINEDNLNYPDLTNYGIVYFENHLKTSKWVINIKDAALRQKGESAKYQQSFFTDFRKTDCPGVIATAYDKIKLPRNDFDNLANLLQGYDNQI